MWNVILFTFDLNKKNLQNVQLIYDQPRLYEIESFKLYPYIFKCCTLSKNMFDYVAIWKNSTSSNECQSAARVFENK